VTALRSDPGSPSGLDPSDRGGRQRGCQRGEAKGTGRVVRRKRSPGRAAVPGSPVDRDDPVADRVADEPRDVVDIETLHQL
jgi:hypothetical protein